MSIRLSIIIPVYNVEKYLDQCFKSFNQQLNEYCEVIIVNDGSTDSSKELCQKFIIDNPKHIIKLINQSNKGLSAARNTGINNATGEYILFLDPDDYLRNDAINTILDKIANAVPDFFFIR